MRALTNGSGESARPSGSLAREVIETGVVIGSSLHGGLGSGVTCGANGRTSPGMELGPFQGKIPGGIDDRVP